ncbi:hypothetical protein CEXT_610691 [Caerostris extrusa]|uniref:Uncharacterized protein n=1 Tax=Caerostris extrusa TaxID=172846 RepID=A0AAV4N6N5_CAEEX|nr:hypothetical protein CEXT_610691 [Caerostris extrusa]
MQEPSLKRETTLPQHIKALICAKDGLTLANRNTKSKKKLKPRLTLYATVLDILFSGEDASSFPDQDDSKDFNPKFFNRKRNNQ